MKLHKLFSLFVLSQAAFAQTTRSYIADPAWAPRDHQLDFIHMRAELSFEPTQKLVKGKVTHLFTPLRNQIDSIWLDATDFKVSAVKLNGKETKYKTTKTGIVVYCTPALKRETKDSLTIVYEATPRKGLYFIGWDDSKNMSRKQIWSQGQGIDNRQWLPMYDEMNDKLTTEMVVTFDSKYKVLSNGTRIAEKDNKNGTKTWHYKMQHPHAPYLTMLAIGIYDVKQSKSSSGVPMNFYYYPEWKNRFEIAYKQSEQMMDFFEKEYGVKYPWESYSQIPVQDYMFGAMENTTATVFGDFLFVDERSALDRHYIGVNAHELAHQWFGDYVTARSDAHHWLQESFAKYCNQLFERIAFGQDFFDWDRRDAQIKSLDESKKNILPVAHSQSGSVRHYPKGAFVLNMLKYVVGGNDIYNKAINHYLKSHPYGLVDSNDLLVAFEEVTGMDLDWFWEEWVYRGGEPGYNVSYQKLENKLMVKVEQVHAMSDLVGLSASGEKAGNSVSADPFVADKNVESRMAGLYKMPIVFEVYYKDGSNEIKTQWIQNQTEEVVFDTKAKEVDYILFDPNNEVLKDCHFSKPFEMLQSQALKAKYMLDRYDAVAAMRNLPISQKRDVLKQVFEKETYHPIKSEIVAQLINDSQSEELIKKACYDAQPKVRRSVIENITTFNPNISDALESILKDLSYETVALALEKLSYLNPSSVNKYLEITKGVEGAVGRNVICKWLEVSYLYNADKPSADKLVEYCSNSYEYKTRVSAAQALKRVNYFSEAALPYLLNASLSANSRLAGPCAETLKYFYDQSAHKALIAKYIKSQTWKPWEWNIVKAYAE